MYFLLTCRLPSLLTCDRFTNNHRYTYSTYKKALLLQHSLIVYNMMLFDVQNLPYISLYCSLILQNM